MSPHSSVVSVSRVRYGFTMGFTVRFRNSFIRLFIYGLEVSLYIKIERRGARGAAKAKSKTKRNSNRRGVSARPASAVGSRNSYVNRHRRIRSLYCILHRKENRPDTVFTPIRSDYPPLSDSRPGEHRANKNELGPKARNVDQERASLA